MIRDSVSCAIARGTGYVACVAAERLIYATMGHHSQAARRAATEPAPPLQSEGGAPT